ncbi:MAG: hypothetical protein R2795_22535 [Saprospiraceae bacterium]
MESFILNWKVAFILAFLLTGVLEILAEVPSTMLWGFLGLTALFSWLNLRGLRKLIFARLNLGLPRLEKGWPIHYYFSYPLLAALPLFLVNATLPFLFLALMSALVYVAHPIWNSNTSLKRFELFSDRKERIERYSRALLKSMLEAGLLHHTSMNQLIIEEKEEGEILAYIKAADHHDTHLFATCLGELMQPIDNPRWLLKLVPPPDWEQGEFYLPVPASLARKKEIAILLCQNLQAALQHPFTPIYTREPAGRLHLLAAKLQTNYLNKDLLPKREILWR